ncbi:MAG: hypothetical protein PHS54_00530 [Clostridia bacterium]|nr:hypothetical protein [Clostridia bacterium]
MIHPNVIIYEMRSADLKSRKAVPIIKLPQKLQSKNADRCVIDQIRCQPKPNNISTLSESPFKNDISQIVKLLGAYCKKNSINEIFSAIKDIHETLNDKEVPELKNWIRLLTGLHPEVDKQLKNLGYWQMPYSEIIGTNTILYYAGPDAVDITFWSKAPTITTNEVKSISYTSPHYIRESMRQKLDSGVVELIQNSNQLTTRYIGRNLIWDSRISTSASTGNEKVQKRPINASVCHGVSLNNDWYHGQRIAACKDVCKNNAITYLKSGGYDVYKLVNHLTPLINSCKAQTVNARFESPLGIEETFPRRLSNIKADIDNSGQKVLKNPDNINNDVLKPEIIQSE